MSSLSVPPPKTPSSARDLSATTTPPRRHPQPSDFARAASVLLSPAKLAKASPTRGLTLEIGDSLGQYDRSKSIQSAPVRPVRRLPAPPLPPAPVTAIEEVAYTTFPCFTPSSAIPSRPLPKPPVPVNGKEETTPEVESAPPPKPMERQRAVRPLPIPIPNTENLSATHSPPEHTSITSPTSAPVNPLIPVPVPSPSVIASFPRLVTPPKKRRHHSASAKAVKAIASTPRKLHTSRSQPDLNIDVVQLHRQLVLNRSPIRLSLDCDSTSDEEYSEETTTSDMLFLDAPEPRKKGMHGAHDPADENSNHADYAWLLSNRILYHQKASDGRIGSKWTREKNGKRYTEEDFSNIINALRSL